MQGAVASLALEPRRIFSVIPPATIMFNKYDLETEENVNTPEVVLGNNPRRIIFIRLYTMEMKMGSFVYAMVNNHLLDTVASSIRKPPSYDVIISDTETLASDVDDTAVGPASAEER